MISPDNLASLIYLKNKLYKWKTISALLLTFSLLVMAKSIFGQEGFDNLSDGQYIAEIKIEGVIFEDDYRSEILKKVADEKSIKAVIINIDSPGGGIVGSEILFEDLRKIASNKPTVVMMGSVAASGGYMAAIASDYIIARNGTLTGSVGVLMQSAEITDLASKIGIKLQTYKSSPLKGSPSPFEKSNYMVDEVIKDSILDSYKFFSGLVKERRAEKLKKEIGVLDGRVFTGRQALEVGLIDEIGGKDQALVYLSNNKIDVKNLAVKEVAIIKNDKNILERFFGFIPFFSGSETKSSNSQIMAIMR